VRVSFVLPHYPWQPTGGFRVAYEYANGLAARGHDVTVVHPRRLQGVRRPRPGTAWRRVLRPLGNLRQAVRERLARPELWWQDIHPGVELTYTAEPTADAIPDGDAVFATAWQTVQYVDPLPESKGRRLYLVMDFPPYLGPADAIADTWRRPLSKVAISSWLESLVREAGGDDVRTIGLGIGDTFHRSSSTPAAVAGSAGTSVAMMVSHSPYKAWRDGLEALRRARESLPGLEADLYGPSPAPGGLEPWMRYHQNLPEPALVALLDRAGVFLCSSLAEGFALPPAEAALRGCAIVTTDCGGNREYAFHEETALVSPPGDPAALAANLVRVVRDAGLRSALAERARARLRSFTWGRATDELEALLTGKGREADAERV
jgi:glycosyltransferase involved in cell wall biosynthesis